MIKTENKKRIGLASSQTVTDSTVAALTAAMTLKKDVMVIVSKDYGLRNIVPAGLVLAVLAYYRVTHRWAELEEDKIRFKFRLEVSSCNC